MSQDFDLGLSFDFMTKNGKILIKFSTFHKLKTKAYIRNLRPCFLYIDVIYKY